MMNDLMPLPTPSGVEATSLGLTHLIFEALRSNRRSRFAEAKRLCQVALDLQRATSTSVDDFDDEGDDDTGRRRRYRNPPPGGDTAELLRGIVTVMERSMPKQDPMREESGTFAMLMSEAQGLQHALDGVGGYGLGVLRGEAPSVEREYSPEEARLRAAMRTRLDTIMQELEKRNAKPRADVDDPELVRRHQAEGPSGGQVDAPHW